MDRLNKCATGLGLKKCLLFSLLVFLTALISANVMITCWLLHILHITPTGMKDLFLTNTSVILNSSAWILGDLHTSFIRGTRKRLHLESDDSLSLSAPKTSLTLDSKGLHFIGESFRVESLDGISHLNFTQDSLRASIKNLNIKGNGNLMKTLQAKEIKSHPDSDIKLTSRTNAIRLQSQGSFTASSPGGNVSLHSGHGAIHLSSSKSVRFESPSLVLPDLKQIQGNPSDLSYQVCICKNGRLYAVPGRLSCLYGNRFCYGGL